MRLYGACFSLFITLTCVCISAQTNSANSVLPKLIRFSGKVSNGSGKTQSVIVGLTFSLYQEEQGGAPLWLETQNIQLDANGHYTASLGASKPEGLPIELFASGEARWLGVQPQGQPEQPRVLLLAVPYALEAVDAGTIGGLPPSAFVLANGEGGTAASESSSSQPSLDVTPKSGAPAALKTVKTPGGSVGFVPLWTSANIIGNSVLFQTPAGAVGIGTTAPGVKTEIANGGSPYNLYLSGFAPSLFFGGVSGINPNGGTGQTSAGYVAFATSAGAYTAQAGDLILATQSWQAGNSNAIRFMTPADDSGDYRPVMNLLRSGNVGIGTATPSARLDVIGGVKVEGAGNGITFPDGSTQTTASAQGPQGPPGPQGAQGPPGPPVHTSAVCGNASCSSACTKGLVSQQQVPRSGGSCFVTSDTGSCGSTIALQWCCVCSP
jgi:hypothetical protein